MTLAPPPTPPARVSPRPAKRRTGQRLDRLAASRPLRGLLAGLMVTVGVLHFVHPEFFMKIMPEYIPADKHRFLVLLSGFFEIAGGVGLLLPQTRRAAAFGLVALYIAVFPANIYLALHPEALGVSAAAAIGRLPFQFLFVAWAALYARAPKTTG